MSQDNPDLINASITAYFFFRDKEQELGKSPHVPFYDFFNYKYQLCVDGTVAAYRLPYLLAGGSLVFKQDSKYYEHYYRDLKPWVHYVPVKEDLSDLVDQIKWAQNNDEKAKQIALNAREFAINNLLPDQIICYYATFLHKWSKLLTNKVEIGTHMELVNVERADNRFKACNCPQTEQKLTKDEL